MNPIFSQYLFKLSELQWKFQNSTAIGSSRTGALSAFVLGKFRPKLRFLNQLCFTPSRRGEIAGYIYVYRYNSKYSTRPPLIRLGKKQELIRESFCPKPYLKLVILGDNTGGWVLRPFWNSKYSGQEWSLFTRNLPFIVSGSQRNLNLVGTPKGRNPAAKPTSRIRLLQGIFNRSIFSEFNSTGKKFKQLFIAKDVLKNPFSLLNPKYQNGPLTAARVRIRGKRNKKEMETPFTANKLLFDGVIDVIPLKRLYRTRPL